MGSGSLQLVATGIEDIYFTENPQMNVFQYKYYRYVNFSNELYKFYLNDSASFNTKTQIVIPKK